ncbi:MFS transporter [Rhizobium sp. BK251]|uniref:MFS transporter n=1 Tax=Rhizobium sp. BK251 TaxID=2512125 RepID=UPI001043E382|nr:MFS transporter [Rhizobium sp. BK251]TCL73847.1 EmrB/QacA subfamily drug resistance transporter [Rhizobium sp. BK251]
MTTVQTTENREGVESGRQARIVALVVAVSFFMQILDGTIVATSLPQMAQSFGVQPVAMSIGITVYMLTTAAFIPLSGWLGDRFGARNVFLCSIAIFTLSSLFCGLSGSLAEFIAARAVQGIGGALMTPVGRIIVLKNARKSELVHAIALITWPALTAPVVGPILGSFITTYLTWHWNFLINIPIGIIGMGLVLRFVPIQREDSTASLDVRGFLLSAAGMTLLLAGLEMFVQASSWLVAAILLCLAGVVFAVLATRHFLTAEHPLLDLSAFRIQTFSMSTLSAGTANRISINATPFLLPLLFQVAFGANAITAGTYLLVYFAGNLGMKTVTTPLLRMFGFRVVLVLNGLISALAIAACGLLSPQTPEVITFALLFVAGLSRSMQFTALNTLAFADIHAAQRSSASTLSSMLQQISMLLGVAVAAAVLNVTRLVRGDELAALTDFRAAFFVIGAIGAISAIRFLQLPAQAGAEVSGHAPRSERSRG